MKKQKVVSINVFPVTPEDDRSYRNLELQELNTLLDDGYFVKQVISTPDNITSMINLTFILEEIEDKIVEIG